MNFKKILLLFSLLNASAGALYGQNAALERTIIDSDRMELQGEATRNVFRFIGNVRITGTNLEARCDEMELVSLREGGDGEDDELISQIGGIVSLIAKGNVRIEQEGRIVEGGLAKIFPKEGYLEITDKP
ncbi:MAG: hypothetical protein AAF212_01330, partial [Verrucomicrobiota bacterium]